jgi:hypothetical protein
MEKENDRPGFIRTRRAAIVSAALTGFVAAVTFRNVFFFPPHHRRSHWFLDAGFILPKWALLPLNFAFYAYLIWLCIVFFRAAQGRERTLVVGWCPGILLDPLSALFPSVAETVQFFDAVGITVAFIASVLIVREFPGRFDKQSGDTLPGAAGTSMDEQHPL